MNAPGVQNERTGLAWQRTGASFAVVGVLATRLESPIAALALGLLAIACAAGLLVAGRFRYSARHEAVEQNQPVSSPGAIAVTSAAACALAAVSLLVIATGG